MRPPALILDEPKPFVLVEALTENGVGIVIRAWCVREDFIFARSSLAKTLKESLQSAGVEIALPQRVVHNV